ncbi:hypothetical protein SJS85_19265 [Aeromonas caviae]|uniref:AbiTii domain-containing protein n=1 Tax=Aeromonas caviae TaxID=648 RepID=UPI0029D6F0A1|nr:hypothetical protein [Aeromonas caviae]MDX7837543.1 hypothetical protein [Aeromonas caviae]
MPALIPQLVDMASTPDIKTSDLLRRALVAASLLGVKELEEWLDSELNGYVRDGGKVHPYRIINCELMWINSGQKACSLPVKLATQEIRSLVHSISELEFWILERADVHLSLSPELERELKAKSQLPREVRLVQRIPIATIHGVVERVRNLVLQWALNLLKDGILGENLSFTEQEKQQGQNTNIINITGDVKNSQFLVASPSGQQQQQQQQQSSLIN